MVRIAAIITLAFFFSHGCVEKVSEKTEETKPPELQMVTPSQPPEGQATPVEGSPTPVEGSPPPPPSTFEEAFAGKAMITVSGTISYKDYKSGAIDLDCFVPEPGTMAKRRLVNKVKLEKPGPYSFKAPAGFGKVEISAFIDLDENGPDMKDPRGEYKGTLTIGDKDISGVDIDLAISSTPPGGGVAAEPGATKGSPTGTSQGQAKPESATPSPPATSHTTPPATKK